MLIHDKLLLMRFPQSWSRRIGSIVLNERAYMLVLLLTLCFHHVTWRHNRQLLLASVSAAYTFIVCISMPFTYLSTLWLHEVVVLGWSNWRMGLSTSSTMDTLGFWLHYSWRVLCSINGCVGWSCVRSLYDDVSCFESKTVWAHQVLELRLWLNTGVMRLSIPTRIDCINYTLWNLTITCILGMESWARMTWLSYIYTFLY